MIGIFPAIKMMMVFSEDVCDISVCLWDFSGGYKPLFYYSYVCLSLFLITTNLCLSNLVVYKIFT